MIPVDIRVIAATNRTLTKLGCGRDIFANLYYRLNVLLKVTTIRYAYVREDIKAIGLSLTYQFQPAL